MVFERVSRLASIPALMLGMFLWLASAIPSAAVTLIHDADIEYGLTKLAFPILRAAVGKEDAGLHARPALALLPRGSVAAQRAEDVLTASEKFDKRKKR